MYAPLSLSVPGDPLRFGSVSGLAFDRTSGQWVGAMDEPGRPRLVWLDVAAGPGTLAVTPVRYTFLRAVDGQTPADVVATVDLESLVPLADGDFAASNEGYIDRGGIAHQPAVLRIARDGRVTHVVQPPPHFTMDPADRSRGVRHNQGIESLTRTPDGRLVGGLEQPLAQDGPVSSGTRGGRVRLIEFVPVGDTWRTGREWAYDLDPTPRQVGYGDACPDGENGLSELFALDDTRLIALERACLRGDSAAPAYNPVRLHLVDLDGAEDVSSRPALAGATVRPVRKQLLLDLTTLASRVPLALRTFENFEGIAEGPPAPDGSPTILLVSDDNFRALQSLAFLWLKRPR